MTDDNSSAVPDVAPPATPAEKLARRLHAEQLDRGGRPYVEHLAAVVGNLLRRWPEAPVAVVDAAWLHDVLEDTETTPESLLAEGVAARAVAIVQTLTRPRDVTYRAWIARLARGGDIWAIRLKLADIEHNSDPARQLPGSDIVERRYRPAQRVLEKALVARPVLGCVARRSEPGSSAYRPRVALDDPVADHASLSRQSTVAFVGKNADSDVNG